MKAEDVISVLKAHEGPLRQRGVSHAALFGSAARGEFGAQSDLDIMVDIDPQAGVDLYAFVGIIHYITDLFSTPVDVSDRAMLHAPVRLTADRDALYAF